CRRPFGLRLQNRALALVVEIAQEVDAVVGDVVERDDDPGLLVVVVVAQRPAHARDRRVLAEPGAGGLLRRQRPLFGVGAAAVAERLVEAADAALRRPPENNVNGRTGA